MHVAKAILLALSPSLIAAWELTASGTRLAGSRTYGCEAINSERGEKLKWHPYEGTQSGSRCCLYVYKRERCDGDSMGFCRDHNDELDFHFRSFEIDCDGRKTGGYQGSPASSYEPYYSPPPAYDTYRPGPPAYDTYRPGPSTVYVTYVPAPSASYEPNRPYEPAYNPPEPVYEPSEPGSDFSKKE